MSDPEWLASITDIELAIAPDCALMDAKHGQFADVRVHDNLEGVGQYMPVRDRFGAHDFLATVSVAVEERRIAFRGRRQESDKHREQFRDAGTVDRRRKADRHQMTFAQRPFEGLVQLLRADGL